MDKQPARNIPLPLPTPRASSRRGLFIAVGITLFILFWVAVAVLIGTGRASVVAVDEAPFNLDTHPIAAATLEPRSLLPPALNKDTRMLITATANEAMATYTGDRATANITVRRYADDAAARAAVLIIGQAVPDPKQHREHVGTAARDYYQYDGGNPGRSGLVYSSGSFVMLIDAVPATARNTYAEACPY